MKHHSFAAAMAFLSLAACAGTGATYRPILDGSPSAGYSTDLKACQSLAESRRWDNEETREDMAFGAALGAALGAIEGDAHDAIGGAVAGLIGGAISGGFKARDDRKAIVVRCLQSRGHNVVG